ncbi:hypothetical protein BGX34_011235 [Mortierella sp. NVP85]|nr:hypothetical protein BGX34_011235 [Mortierella sp. NVP85]
MGEQSSPWGLYGLIVFCIIITLSGFLWCFCCGTWDMMHAVGLSWFLPARYMQPSFITSTGYRRRNSGNEEEPEDIDMDILIDDQHDSSVEYDYDLSEDEPNDDEIVSTTYPRRQC